MAVRSLEVAHGTLTAALATVFTVPVGYTLLLKDVRITNNDTVTRTYNVSAKRGAEVVPLIRSNAIPIGGQLSTTGMFIVLEAGDELQMSASAAGVVMFWFSGALLLGVA